MTSRVFIPSAEVADRLDMTRNTFLQKRQLLEDRHGFPQPMPHQQRPMLWRADQVDQWIEAQGLPRDIEDRIDPALVRAGSVVLLAEARRP